MPNYRDEIVTVDVEAKDETNKAWLLVFDGDNEKWVPKSIGVLSDDETEIDLPTWWLEKEELL
jgi:hypothetical protein